MNPQKKFLSLSAAPYGPDTSPFGRPVEVTAFGKQEAPPPPPPETELDRMIRRMYQGVTACHEKKAYVSCATLISTHIESLGGFLIGSEKEMGDSEERFVTFIQRYFKSLLGYVKSAAEHAKKDPAEYPKLLYKKFRCGLIHEYIMKEGTALRESVPMVYSPYVEITPEFELILNINDFYTEFGTAIAMFKEDAQKDPEVSANFGRRMAYLTNRARL